MIPNKYALPSFLTCLVLLSSQSLIAQELTASSQKKNSSTISNLTESKTLSINKPMTEQQKIEYYLELIDEEANISIYNLNKFFLTASEQSSDITDFKEFESTLNSKINATIENFDKKTQYYTKQLDEIDGKCNCATAVQKRRLKLILKDYKKDFKSIFENQ